MTKKHFEGLAAALYFAFTDCEIDDPPIAETHKTLVITRVSDWLATTNPRFDSERFILAAKYGQKKEGKK